MKDPPLQSMFELTVDPPPHPPSEGLQAMHALYYTEKKTKRKVRKVYKKLYIKLK
jgi:hypothetical protein